MASILRSGKFVRYFAGFTRNFVFNSARESEESLVQNTQCLCSTLTHGFATAAAKPDQNLEKYLKRLDQDVRRTGRISRRDIEEVLEEIRLQRSATSSQSLLVIRCCGSLVPEELPEVRTALVQEIWKTLNALNVPMDISHYNALLRVFLENEHQFSPADFLADLEAKGVEPNRVTYQRLISRYCQQGDIEGATRILEFMREKEFPVNENVFNALILGHSEANDLESAAGIIGVMKQAGLEASADTYSTLLCCYARHGQLQAILRTFDECETNEIYLLDKDLLDVVYALTINGHSDKIDEILSRLRKSAGFNQDAVNIILRLTNKGYEDVALRLLKSMPRGTRADGELSDTGNFFIRQLVKAGRSTGKILEICKDLQENGFNSNALLVAVEAGLTNGLIDSTLPLLREVKNAGSPIRQHYFWPMICSAEPNRILDVVSKMQDEFEMSPSSETLRDYVIPNLKEKNLERIVNILCDAGVTPATATNAAAHYGLTLNKLKEVATITSKFRSYYSPGLFRKPLIAALGKTNDFDSFLKFVRQYYDGLSRVTIVQQTQSDLVDEETDGNDRQRSQAEQLGILVYDAVVYFKLDRLEKIEKILSGLVAEGLSISSTQAERIQDRLGAEMTVNISEMLGKLSAGDLEPVELEKSDSARRGAMQNMSIPQIERIIANAEARNENTNGLKRILLGACLRSRDVEKTEEVIAKLEGEDYVLGSGVYAQLIDLYCHHSDLEKALKIYEKVKAKEPDFVLDNLKTIRIVDLFVKANQIDEAIKFLENNKKDELRSEEKNFNYKTSCWRVLNMLAEAGNVQDLDRLFNTLVENNYIEPSNVMLGPLVKVNLAGTDDLKKAVDKFEEICTKYQVTPWKNELACRLIQAEDASNLQRLTDLSTNIHGEVNSLYDLVFSFVDCGRIRQARKILETPGLRSRPQRINSACERYRTEGMVQSLEGLVEATKDLNHIDRSDIYYNLLLSYRKEDQPDKALGLWTKMQEEDISPTDVFLTTLSDFLKEKNLEVPFVVPTSPEPRPPAKTETNKSKKQPAVAKDSVVKRPNINQYREAVKRGDIEAAKLFLEQLNAETKLTIGDHSIMVEALVKAGRLSEATKTIFDMLAQNTFPVPRIFKFYMNKLANAGDVATMEQIGKLITVDTKRLVSFDNRLCHANVVAGNAESYLNGLLDEIINARTDEEVANLAAKFPRGGALGMIENNPQLYPKFEELAEKYAAKNHYGPINILWIHNVVLKNDEVSQKLWDKYLSSHPQLMFQRVLQTAREQSDSDMMQKLIGALRTGKVTEGAVGNAYSCYLDILATQEKFDEGLELLKVAINDVCLEHINRTALMRLRDGLIKNGKQFPYKIPDRTPRNDTSSSSSSSSSGSSDDDIPKDRKPESRVPPQKNQ